MAANQDPELVNKLQQLVETVDITNFLVEPLTRSIARLMEVAAADLGSSEASVLIRDGDQGDLRFLTAIGEVADQLLGMKVPAGKGIAGFVLSSGQPMVVSDVGEEESFYAEVDKATGYSTQMILATPLRFNDEVIGVLEFINRSGPPPWDQFTPDEMDKAAHCAEAIASLVNAYESAKLFRELGDRTLSEPGAVDLAAVREWLAGVRSSAEHREMMDLALLLREIAGRGDAERAMCRDILEAILRFSETKNETSFLG